MPNYLASIWNSSSKAIGLDKRKLSRSSMVTLSRPRRMLLSLHTVQALLNQVAQGKLGANRDQPRRGLSNLQ